VLDTSVLLADPGALRRFEEHEVVLPVVVITELEAKRHHPELGYFARSALRLLDELRVTHGRLDEAVPVGDGGGTVRVELNHTDAASLPSGFRLGDNDTRILAVAHNLAHEGHAVTLVSKDLPMRIKASAVGLDAEEYRAESGVKGSDSDSGYTGMAELDVTAAELDELYDDGTVDLAEARDLPCHSGLVLLSERGTALARVGADKQVHLVRGDREAFGIHGRSAEQRVALEMLLDPEPTRPWPSPPTSPRPSPPPSTSSSSRRSWTARRTSPSPTPRTRSTTCTRGWAAWAVPATTSP
jgi:PhoH-like ATPase